MTDSNGETAVRAGRYIRDNIYLGVEAGSGGSTKGTVNLDISRNLKVKGALGSEGDSSGGIFYEKTIERSAKPDQKAGSIPGLYFIDVSVTIFLNVCASDLTLLQP